MALPAWFTAIAHFPTFSPVTVLPLNVHTSVVVLVKATSRPEVAVALTVVVPPISRSAGLKLIAFMLWFILLTVMFCVTWGAAM